MTRQQTCRLERTAPRAVDDRPKPAPEGARQSLDDFPAPTFTTPDQALEMAEVLILNGERLRDQAALAMLRRGLTPAAVSAAAGIPQKQLRQTRGQDERRRQRLEYSRNYYERHPGRIPDERYALEDGDPDLPETPIGVRERPA